MGRMINAKELMQIIPMSSKTIYNRIKVGELPKPIKIGQFNYWKSEDIEKVCRGEWTSATRPDNQPNPA